MRILYHHRVGSRDGQAVHIDELIHAFRSEGHEVVVVGPPGFERSAIGEGSRVAASIKRHLPKFAFELAEVAYNLPTYFRLRRAMRRAQPDFIYERYGLFLVAGTLLSRQTGIPLFLEVNSPLALERGEFGGLTLQSLATRLERWTWRHAARVLPVTGVLAEHVRAAGVSDTHVAVIPNGIDPERFPDGRDTERAKAALGLAGKVVLGFTGFIRTWHGLASVIEYLARPDTPRELHLLVVGDGPARAELEHQADQLGLRDRVTFTGLAARDDVAALIEAFDIALQPRAVSYASPLKLFEYMASSRAIVAPDQPNIREILSHETNALLFEPEKPDAMAAAISRMATDGALRERLGAAARRTIFDRQLLWKSNAQKIVGLVAEQIAGRASEAPATRSEHRPERRRSSG